MKKGRTDFPRPALLPTPLTLLPSPLRLPGTTWAAARATRHEKVHSIVCLCGGGESLRQPRKLLRPHGGLRAGARDARTGQGNMREELGNRGGMVTACGNLGLCHNHTGAYATATALAFYMKQHAIATELKNLLPSRLTHSGRHRS